MPDPVFRAAHVSEIAIPASPDPGEAPWQAVHMVSPRERKYVAGD